MFSLQTYRSILKGLLFKNAPFYIQFYISNRCNLMCRQCNIVETNSRISEMSLDQIRSVAANIRKIGGGIVLLTGGEPFLRDDLPEIVEIFSRQKLNVRLQTAGTKMATTEKLQACYDAGARDINVSLDSLDLNKFDYINGVPASGQNAIEAIERISRIFRHKSAILSFGTVFSRYNYLELPAIIYFARQIGWYVSVVPVHIAKPSVGRGFQSFDQSFLFKEEDVSSLERTIDEVLSLKQRGFPVFDSEKFLRSSVEFLKGNAPLWRSKGVCDSPNLYFAVRPNGDFTTCCDYTLTESVKVYSDKFVSDYRSRSLHKNPEVQNIIKTCSGCHYGSYPEVTLSARNMQALRERVKLTLTVGQGKLKKAPVQEDFMGELNRVKALFGNVYSSTSWLTEEMQTKLESWSRKDSRTTLLRDDMVRRLKEGRVRGRGGDLPVES